jgi:hypothetical protein
VTNGDVRFVEIETRFDPTTSNLSADGPSVHVGFFRGK